MYMDQNGILTSLFFFLFFRAKSHRLFIFQVHHIFISEQLEEGNHKVAFNSNKKKNIIFSAIQVKENDYTLLETYGALPTVKKKILWSIENISHKIPGRQSNMRNSPTDIKNHTHSRHSIQQRKFYNAHQ